MSYLEAMQAHQFKPPLPRIPYRDLKHVVDVRPVYHRKSKRIKAHVLLCWLALLLIRITEGEVGEQVFVEEIEPLMRPFRP